MNLNHRHNAFSDIPGFDASKGERIVKALQRLWEKIEKLEQLRISERKSRSEEVQTSSDGRDLTITDVQYKLLVLQLQYARSVLRKRMNPDDLISHEDLTENNKFPPEVHKHILNPREANSIKSFSVISQETQTGDSLLEGVNPIENSDIVRHEDEIDIQVSTGTKKSKFDDRAENTAFSNYRTLQSSSKLSSQPHYHLKLDDVPFILGASSTASHSVVANVQNIIAMMKSHNKALCGPKHIQRPFPSMAANAFREDSCDSTKMLNELSQDLCELMIKQEQLAKRLDATQGIREAKSVESKEKSKVNKPIEKNCIDGNFCPQLDSDHSTKLHAEVKNSSKVKDIARYNTQQKQNVSGSRSQLNNPPNMARRKLLRSLQNFKTHLSEEDISWN